MLAIVIGKHEMNYYVIKKKNQDKHFFVVKGQEYTIFPDSLTPCDIYQNGAYVGTDSIAVFEENGVRPYHCKYPRMYDMEYILASMDEHKLMIPKKQGWRALFGGGGPAWKTLLEFMPWLLIGFVLLYSLVFK